MAMSHPAAAKTPAPPHLEAPATDEALERVILNLAVGARLDRAGVMASEHLTTGGRRIRGRLAREAGVRFGLPPEETLHWAAAVELLHNATLVHDDIQDGDHLRRGRPTVWARHGVAQAINCGDLLLMLPFVAVSAIPCPEKIRARLCRAVADRAQHTVRGQVDEMELLPGRRLDRRAYRRAVIGKTGQLLALPVEGAALLAGRSPEAARSLATPFEDLGLLYQLQDDVVDLYGDKGRDAPGADLHEGKVSGLVVAHLERHPDDRDWLLALLDAPREQTPTAEVREALQRFRTGGALEEVFRWIDTITARIDDAAELRDAPGLQFLASSMIHHLLAPLAHLRSLP